MDTYSPDVTCPKCASDHGWHRVEWRPHEPEHQKDGRPGINISKPLPDDLVTVPAKPERMEIECGRCLYHWQMRPIKPEDDGWAAKPSRHGSTAH